MAGRTAEKSPRKSPIMLCVLSARHVCQEFGITGMDAGCMASAGDITLRHRRDPRSSHSAMAA